MPDPTVLERDLALELADATIAVARAIRRNATEQLDPLGITFGQGRLIRLLAREPLRMAEIAHRLGVVPRSATDAVDALQQQGLATRAADPDDRRSVLVELTDDGRDLVHRLTERRGLAAHGVFAALPTARQHQLLDLLRTCTNPTTNPTTSPSTNPSTSGTTAGEQQ
jgi:DNA-binding MarR family transcriptional regulator